MNFAPRIVYGDIDLTAEPYMVEFGFDLGRVTTLYEVISSLMPDGSLTYSPGAGNRESLRLSVITEAPDSGVSADYGVPLEREAGKDFSTVTFYPGDGFGAATVLETFTAQVTHDWDQDLERQGLRRYVLEIPALPFGRSVDPVVLSWSGPSRELSPLSSYSGWTTVSGTAPTVGANPDGAGSAFLMAGTVTFQSPAVLLDDYLWIKATDASIGGVQVDGTTIPTSQWRNQLIGGRRFYTIPTKAWRGQTVPVRFVSMTGQLLEFYTTSYPTMVAAADDLKPRGIGAIDVGGSARTQCVISFTAPTGGAFVITGPDPNMLLRDRGTGESVFAHFTVTTPTETSIGGRLIRHEVGTHSRGIGFTDPQPVTLNPDGIWPQVATGPFTGAGISAGAIQYAYPNDPYGRIGVTFFDTPGAKTLISPGLDLPTGYTGETAHHEQHALYAGRSLFAVLDTNGYPIPATVTYFKRWKHHAAEEE